MEGADVKLLLADLRQNTLASFRLRCAFTVQ